MDVPALASWEWLIGGLLVSGVGGALASPLVVRLIRNEWSDSSAIWMGMVERAFFTIGATYGGPQAIVPTMAAWIAAKMAAGWLYDKPNPRASAPTKLADKKKRMSALAGNLSSMAFALAGGLVVGGDLTWTT